MRFPKAFAVALAIATTAWACGGSDDPGPTGPSPGGPTITIVADRASQSFSPNPATVAQGATFSWRNNDSVVHRIVMNDGSLDTGNIAPGASSPNLTLATNGGNYHCTIHPTMVGSINSSSGAPPPCTGLYCGE